MRHFLSRDPYTKVSALLEHGVWELPARAEAAVESLFEVEVYPTELAAVHTFTLVLHAVLGVRRAARAAAATLAAATELRRGVAAAARAAHVWPSAPSTP